jgi:tetratricopeptide (TPR) repeat protein
MSLLKTQAISTALNGDWEKAIKLNKQLLKDDPKDVEALNRIALAYIVLGKSTNARSMYRKVLEIDPLNSIALKNLKKIKPDGKKNKEENGNNFVIQVNNIFLEETGKTKIVDLINLAQSEVLSKLKTGQAVNLSIKRLKIFVHGESNNYIGVLPDDIGKRLIKFIKGGSRYEAFVKSAKHNGVSIFIRELKRASRFREIPSFLFPIEKPSKKSLRAKKVNEEQAVIEEDQIPSEEFSL